MMQDENSSAGLSARLDMMEDCTNRLLAPLVPNSRGSEWLANLEASSQQFHGYVPDTTILPASIFRTEGEANSLWERVAENLIQHKIGPSNVWPIIDSIFEELALNAAQHSASQAGCCATVEHFVSGDEILYVVGVVDLGIGILSSLQHNPTYQHINDEYDAISRALELDVTGTLELRGAGLHYVTERVQNSSGELVIISGDGFLMVRNGRGPFRGDFIAQNWSSHPGTLVLVAIPVPQMRQ